MGANCCVAARDKPLPDRISREISSYRNVRHSPSWSFRWDNRTHIEDIVDNPSWLSQHNSGNIGSESKSVADTETDGHSDGGSPLDTHWTPQRMKKVGFSASSKSIYSDQSTRSNSSLEGKCSLKPSAVGCSSDMKPAVSVQSEASSSRKARRSPGYQLSRQISDSRILSLKSLNESSGRSPGRESFVLSVCSNDLSRAGSHGGSSDGWSMRTFSELVAASSHSQRERWSVDSENPSSVSSKTTRSSPPSAALLTCRVCLKLLKERSPWCGQKIVSTNELSVAAVLVCGHVYHAECLENVTSEIDRYDPPCPVCTNGEKSSSKYFGKAERKAKSKISRRAIADMDVYSARDQMKQGGKSPSVGASSSMKASFGRPFLRRHFSLGPRSPPVEVSQKKKGLWARYRRA